MPRSYPPHPPPPHPFTPDATSLLLYKVPPRLRHRARTNATRSIGALSSCSSVLMGGGMLGDHDKQNVKLLAAYVYRRPFTPGSDTVCRRYAQSPGRSPWENMRYLPWDTVPRPWPAGDTLQKLALGEHVILALGHCPGTLSRNLPWENTHAR